MNNPRVLSGKEQDRMCNNGWFLVIAEPRETTEELYNRLSKKYNKVKVYYSTTAIKGYHDIFAMVKRC